MPTVHVEAKPVFYSLSGAGALRVLFIHGSGEDHTLWDDVRRLLEPHVAVVAPDLNGRGRSPVRPGNGLTTYTQDALAVLQVLDGPTVVMGHSLGGAVALNVALQRPDGLAGIGLIGSGARLRVLPTLLQLIQDDFEGAVEYLLGLLFHRSLPAQVERARASMLRNGQQALQRDFLTCNSFDVMALLGEVKVPAWVVVGEHDQLTPVKYATYLAQNLPNASLSVLPDAGHNLMLEQPQAFYHALLAFLDRVR